MERFGGVLELEDVDRLELELRRVRLELHRIAARGLIEGEHDPVTAMNVAFNPKADRSVTWGAMTVIEHNPNVFDNVKWIKNRPQSLTRHRTTTLQSTLSSGQRAGAPSTARCASR